ncbi:hypothetical protein KAFR_0G03010 [Kazachstania africana CBS 2517]|uniref:ABC transporter domain-containing protein n=1 Tax=Kazachstania africana (strain ATCC 22294 / BCRC 22015 / CBS 2517 / CECT 1963 / NBRC 1671 / NRRL Y-8276) TaxID=1071382 RepID=H2AY83_KAZAF|nr:hypothetical protein KAFR_0G03010 [Kazachstania africana CBS 2517]CCF59333.1 hypothetical protein KAFR_0G03010 [Kazachstania africana CBS 2517]
MSISKYFTPVSDASVTFDGTNVDLSANLSADDATDGIQISQLNDVTFKADGGEVVLVLGKPTSALFKSLFHSDKNLNYEPQGSVRFKTNEIKAYNEKCPHQIIYNNEQDVHFPFLTVKQTIDFALSCKFDIPKEERDTIRNDILKNFGLSHVLDTIVGNDFFRGVSGGERKRISIIETFIANGSVYLWDNSTKGLDSSTALDFLSILQTMAKTTKSVNFVKISQASDKIVEKFDKILLLSDSYQIFYGTIDECMTHFRETLGIEKNPNDCMIEYLTSILNLQFKSTQNISDTSISRSASNPKDDFEVKQYPSSFRSESYLYNQWINSPNYNYWKQATSDAINNSNGNTLNPEDITPVYNIPITKQLNLVIRRAFQRSLGDKIYLSAQMISIIIQSIVIGSLFYNTPRTTIGSYSRGSLTFFSLLFFTFLSLAEMPSAFQRQPVITKQAKLRFYHLWVESLATTIFDYSYKFILVVVFSILLYFLAHLQYNAARFFIFLLLLTTYNFSMVSLFSLISLLTPTLAIANLVAGILLLAIAMYASYVIYLSGMHPWFKWIAWINPSMYAMEGILSNELFNMKLSCADSIVPRGVGYDNVSFTKRACAWQGATLGNDYVRGQDYLSTGLSYSYSHVWRNFGVIIAFIVFFICCSLVAAEYIKPRYNDASKKDTISSWIPFVNSSRNANNAVDMATRPRRSESFSSISIINSTKSADGTLEETSVEGVASQKHIISWKNINYTVAGNKQLINDVSGYISSGLTALMGESGAGKTTLLNVLSQRTESGVVTGELLIDGQPLTNINAFRRSIGFVQQQDIHLELLTVKESLEISCILRGDGDKDYILTVSKLLKLPLDKIVADLTPTQKKLLSIGVELVTKPSLLLFLDEPTSGLDSEAALTIVQFLKKLSEQGQAIFCTIHQPSKSVISYFDNIFLLKRGGETVYFGPTSDACDYFMKYNPSLTFNPEAENPADFIIDVVGSNNTGTDSDEIAEAKPTVETKWAEVWSRSQERASIENDLLDLENEARGAGIDFSQRAWTPPSYMGQLRLILRRQYIVTKRDKSYVGAKYALNGGAGLFIGFSFWRIKESIIGLQYSLFFCFMALCVSSPLINQVQDKALKSKEVFIARESRSNTYHWSVLLLAQLLIELPLAITSSTLFFLCAYFCCNFDNSPHIAGVFYLNYIVFAAYYCTFGLWLIYASPNLQTAAVLVAFFYSFTASFCGVMQPKASMGWWIWMYWVSPYTYFIETFVSLVLHERPVVCGVSDLVPGTPPTGETCGDYLANYVAEHGGYVYRPTATNVCAYCTYKDGDEFLKVESMSYDHIWRNFGIQVAYVGFNIFAMFGGYYLTYVRNFWPGVFKVISMLIPFKSQIRKAIKK